MMEQENKGHIDESRSEMRKERKYTERSDRTGRAPPLQLGR